MASGGRRIANTFRVGFSDEVVVPGNEPLRGPLSRAILDPLPLYPQRHIAALA